MRAKYRPFEDRIIRDGHARGLNSIQVAALLPDRSLKSIQNRAVFIGIRFSGPRKEGEVVGGRKCLMHGGKFKPAHKHEFVCGRCKQSPDWKSGVMI